MYIPSFLNIQCVQDTKFFTDGMQLFFDTLINSMENALSDNGWTVPQQTQANIEAIVALSNPPPNGTIWYDTDNNVFVGLTNAGLVKFTTSAYP